MSQLWVGRWSGTNVQTVEAGWQVWEGSYGDWNPHLFIYFTTHTYDPGYPAAYNLEGGYFVQTDSTVIIGGSLAGLVSTVGGTQQTVALMFYRDQGGSHNWWLKYGNTWVGYYPNSLFSSWGIADKGGFIDYGGEIINAATGGRHTTTDMGSGRFPSEGWEASAFIKRIQYVDMNNAPQNAGSLIRDVSNASYYDLALNSSGDTNWAQYFYLGGPGFLPCTIGQFAVNPLSANIGSSFTISYSVSGSGGGGLAGAQLWRASTDGTSIDRSWQAVGSPVLLSGNSWSGSFTDTPTTTGNYWYGMHVWDNVGNSATERLAGLAPVEVSVVSPSFVSVMVQPSLSGLSFAVDGTNYTSAQAFSWLSGSSHTIATSSPQVGATGVRYIWNGWSDGLAISHSVAPTNGATYTASFTTQYYLTMNAGTGGSVSPASDWYGSGAGVSISATPANGYSFSGWAGTGSGCYSGTSASASVTMNGPVSQTASFTANPGNISVTVQADPPTVSFAVDGTNYSAAKTFGWSSGSGHTIATSSPQSGGTGIQYIWSNWSDGGEISHTVAPISGTTYTANFATQYRLDTAVSPAGSGTVALSPPGTWFSPGQAVQLTASPASGYAFLSWAGVDSSSGSVASVTMDGYRSAAASFTAISPVVAYRFITLAGSTDAGSQNGAGGAARFNFETGVASDAVGNVYVADTYNSTIRKISSDGVVTTVAGLASSPGSANGVGSAARFLWPNGVAVDGGGTVYVADTYNSTIRKITPAGSVSTLAGAAGVAGFSDGLGGAARFNQPIGVAVDRNSVLYVADAGNNSIRRIAPDGVVGTLAGWTNAVLNAPAGVGVDGMGNVVVADTGNNTIRKMTTNGVVSTLAGLAGSAGYADGAGTHAQFNGPAGVAVDGAGNVYVVDTYNYTIRRVASDGTVTTIAGAPGRYGYQDGAGTNALFDFASGIALDGRGNVYVADTDNNVIRKGWWSGTLPEIVLHSPKASGGQVQLDFTLRTGPANGFSLLSAAQVGGPWGPDPTAVLTTNVLGVSYSFTTWPGASAGFYRIQSR